MIHLKWIILLFNARGSWLYSYHLCYLIKKTRFSWENLLCARVHKPSAFQVKLRRVTSYKFLKYCLCEFSCLQNSLIPWGNLVSNAITMLSILSCTLYWLLSLKRPQHETLKNIKCFIYHVHVSHNSRHRKFWRLDML